MKLRVAKSVRIQKQVLKSAVRMLIVGTVFLAPVFLTPVSSNAQNLNTPLGGFSKDNNAPIDIVADELEIKQKENVAIFSGKVKVVQGKLTLKAARLVVEYTDTGKKKKGKPDTKKKKDGEREISKLNATGGVIVTSDTQSATGDWATMDVKKNTIIMGDNVVISQDGNVIRGNKVLVDLNTGYSRIISSSKTGGRVRAIFKPKKK
jgi:lipopolysaccharide export system protein LptA